MPKIILEIEVDELTPESLRSHQSGKLVASFKINGSVIHYPIVSVTGTCSNCEYRGHGCPLDTWDCTPESDQYCDAWGLEPDAKKWDID